MVASKFVYFIVYLQSGGEELPNRVDAGRIGSRVKRRSAKDGNSIVHQGPFQQKKKVNKNANKLSPVRDGRMVGGDPDRVEDARLLGRLQSPTEEGPAAQGGQVL